MQTEADTRPTIRTCPRVGRHISYPATPNVEDFVDIVGGILGKLHFSQDFQSVSPYLCRRLRSLNELVRERAHRNAAALARQSLTLAPTSETAGTESAAAGPGGRVVSPGSGGSGENVVHVAGNLHLPPYRRHLAVLVDQEG